MNSAQQRPALTLICPGRGDADGELVGSFGDSVWCSCNKTAQTIDYQNLWMPQQNIDRRLQVVLHTRDRSERRQYSPCPKNTSFLPTICCSHLDSAVQSRAAVTSNKVDVSFVVEQAPQVVPRHPKSGEVEIIRCRSVHMS